MSLSCCCVMVVDDAISVAVVVELWFDVSACSYVSLVEVSVLHFYQKKKKNSCQSTMHLFSHLLMALYFS